MKEDERTAFRLLHDSTDEIYGLLGLNDPGLTRTHRCNLSLQLAANQRLHNVYLLKESFGYCGIARARHRRPIEKTSGPGRDAPDNVSPAARRTSTLVLPSQGEPDEPLIELFGCALMCMSYLYSKLPETGDIGAGTKP